jgi:hypothetical protein
MTTVLRQRKPIRIRAGARDYVVAVRESERAKTMRLIVGPRRPLELTVPAGTPERAVAKFLEQRGDWIERKVAAAAEIAARPRALGLEGKVWLEGRPLEVERVDRKLAQAELRDGVLKVSGHRRDAKGAVERWYRREARRRIRQVAAREAQRLQIRFNSIAIRDQKTRWGSCSARGNVSFSWRLVLCPPEVLEYVVVHELLHRREPNHSKAFWRLLDQARPGWREQARWLREHGTELHEYSPLTIQGA